MKIYKYKCSVKGCGDEFESYISDPDKLSCPSCLALTVFKVFPVPNIHFKGNGFYKTDNKKGK